MLGLPIVFVPLRRMPLNPNGKVDKPALPFPDTAEAAFAPAAKVVRDTPKLSSTEAAISEIWSKLLPSPPSVIPVDESFFDLGGHSILATRLIFELRNTFVVDAPLGLVFERPTIKLLAQEIDNLRDPDFGLAQEPNVPSLGAANGSAQRTSSDYGADFDSLVTQLAPQYQSPKWTMADGLVVFLTGATGFLGAYILRDLLDRPKQVTKVICLVRAKSSAEALNRLRDSAADRGIWKEDWVSSGRVVAFCGDLSTPHYGLNEVEWDELGKSADVVLHNGAMVRICLGDYNETEHMMLLQVHWVFPYHKLREANVISTMTAIQLAANEHKPKLLSFVSSTSALDASHYVRLSDDLASTEQPGIPEDDDLEGARSELKNGYGQSKWVGEKLLMEAAERGLAVSIVRPGYVVGDSASAGVCAFAIQTTGCCFI